jgi:hypothetical protein
MDENFGNKKISGVPVVIIIIVTILVTASSVVFYYSIPNKQSVNTHQDGRFIMERLQEKAVENDTSK